MSDCLVSVSLITYNHVKYIRQAVEGILMQQVNFSFDVIIADDFSTDGTREILTEYKNKFPNIQLILQKENVGPAQNVIDLLSAPQSKYVAYLEGDDFWTDPFKLQKQVDFLEANPQISGCYHDVIVVDEDGKLVSENYYLPEKEEYNQSDCLINGGDYCTGIFFKALANFQWDKLLGTDIISLEYLEGCYQLGQQYPDLCSSIFLMCEKGK